jgi:Protein of unknown function (DUF3047)
MTKAALGLLSWVCGLAGAVAAPTANLLSDPTGAMPTPAPPWRVAGLPRQDKPLTRYRVVYAGGERVLEIDAQASYGNLVHEWPAGIEARRLSWRWRIEIDNAQTNLRSKAGDDHAVAVCVMFDLPLQALPFWERQGLWLARALSAEMLPAATLCYGWDARLPAGTVLDSPYTRRVRWIVLRGAGDALGAWRGEQRDLQADFVRLFGDESARMPPVRAVLVAGDADNTQGHSLAQLADLVLQ